MKANTDRDVSAACSERTTAIVHVSDVVRATGYCTPTVRESLNRQGILYGSKHIAHCVRHLHGKGYNGKRIAKALGISPATVYRYLRAP